MENILNIIESRNFILGMAIVLLVLLLLVITLIIKFSVLNRRYKNFMTKLGNGKNIQEDLQNYILRVDKIENQNGEIENKIKVLNEDLKNCIQKVGIVRYNAFKDTGSDLSFTLALLNENNDGVILNGIYSREMSNIYAKPVEAGKSKYTISKEEQEAINKAIEANGIYKMK